MGFVGRNNSKYLFWIIAKNNRLFGGAGTLNIDMMRELHREMVLLLLHDVCFAGFH